MKVISKLAATLALAVPLSLVTADELVINNHTNADIPATGDYSPDMQEALKLTPAGYEQIVVVPPGYDKPLVIAVDNVNSGIHLQNVNLPVTNGIAARAEALIP